MKSEAMPITNDMIKQLRERTGAGMMDCKRALESVNGDMNAAIEYLRKKGAAVSQKRADRSAKEGVIASRITPGGKQGILVEVNCETDFVGRSEDFIRFAQAVADAIAQGVPKTVDEVHRLSTAGGQTIADLMNDLLAKVSEKVEIRRFDVFRTTDGVVSGYTHVGNKIGVLVELAGGGDDHSVFGRDIAMQVAAMNPLVVSRDQVEKSQIESELEIYRTQAKNEGKPQQVVDRIAMGRLDKFYQEVCLIEQTFIKDPGKSVREYLDEAGTKAGSPVSVRRFRRFHLGEDSK